MGSKTSLGRAFTVPSETCEMCIWLEAQYSKAVAKEEAALREQRAAFKARDHHAQHFHPSPTPTPTNAI